jgi:hypothetical protein
LGSCMIWRQAFFKARPEYGHFEGRCLSVCFFCFSH